MSQSTVCPRYCRGSQFYGLFHLTFLYLHVLRGVCVCEYYLFLYLQSLAQCLVLKNIYCMEMEREAPIY